ncbi:MAG: glutathione peroxidase [Nitrospinales bacterium]
MRTIYSIPLRTIRGQATDLSAYRGKVLLIVNVASRCGFTPQYRGLQTLREKYRDAGLEILAFPCNDFGAQEPGGEAEIKDFCATRFGVEFPLFAKVKILGGAAHPLYRFLQDAGLPLTAPGDLLSILFDRFKPVIYFLKGMRRPTAKNAVQWNFHKFLIGRDGHPAAHFAAQMDPLDPRLTRQIDQELARPCHGEPVEP